MQPVIQDNGRIDLRIQSGNGVGVQLKKADDMHLKAICSCGGETIVPDDVMAFLNRPRKKPD